MEITEVRIKLMDEDSGERLKAFCSITFDDSFVVRDLKIIEGSNGPFVAMPSRKLTAHCPQCGTKNHLRAGYCNHCGKRMAEGRINKDDDGRAKLYADIAHPINSRCREMIQNRVVEEFQSEFSRSKQDGYISRYDDIDLDVDFSTPAEAASAATNEKAPEASPAAQPTVVLPDGNSSRRDAEPQKQTRVQSAQMQPPAPHRKPPADHEASKTDEQSQSDGFGAGIFED